MPIDLRAGVVALAAGALVALASPGAAEADADPIYTGTFSSLAVGGYDPVAYFTDGEPVEGSGEHEYEWMGATWRFATPDHLAAFEADPEAYAPQYGGYCAYAVALGDLVSADPNAWRIVDGRLYLNYDQNVQATWEEDVPGYITKADANWPEILDE